MARMKGKHAVAAIAMALFLFCSCFPQILVSASSATSATFTIIVLPDTQGYVKWYPNIFDNQTQWIVNNKEALNIVFVTQLGDLVDQNENVTQWENANRSLSKLDGAVPWAVLPGNHDINNANFTNYDKYFSASRFKAESWYGGTYVENDNSNNYELFSAAGGNYLVLHLQNDPTDDVLWWAGNVIDQHPDRRVIISTHDYLMGFYRLGQRSEVGERIYHSLVKQHAAQVFLVLCGHSGAEDLMVDTVNGNTVYQVLSDFQSGNLQDGWLRIMEFQPEQNKIQVKTYSSVINEYKNGTQSEFTLDYDFASAVPEIPFPIPIAVLVVTAATLTLIATRNLRKPKLN
jgi:3',5'-cyclic AMP phosphodiesterase CpdA